METHFPNGQNEAQSGYDKRTLALQGTLAITQIKKLSSREGLPKCSRETSNILCSGYYCSKTHHHGFRDLKQHHSFYITWFPWVRILGRAHLGCSSLRSLTGLRSDGGRCWNSWADQVSFPHVISASLSVVSPADSGQSDCLRSCYLLQNRIFQQNRWELYHLSGPSLRSLMMSLLLYSVGQKPT